MSNVTLNDLNGLNACVYLHAWGLWFAEVTIDGEHTLAKGTSVTLTVADLILKGTVLSGGPSTGKSMFRIVSGAGGWGRQLKRKGYSNDAGVKVATVLGDAAGEVGETLAPVDSSLRVGPAFARDVGTKDRPRPASSLLELLAPGAWYVDEAGTTRLGARAPSVLPAGVTHGPVDAARGKVTLASTTIAGILPGLVVDGLTAVDVLHEVSPKGLRSTIYGALTGAGSRDADAVRRTLDQLDPARKFRGVTEYRVESLAGKRLNLEPVLKASGMPDLPRVPIRPGVAGCDVTVAEGARVLVGFVNSDPGRPYVAGFEDTDSDTFQSTKLNLLAGGQAGGEHVATVEGTVLLIYNVLVALMAVAGGGPLVAAVIQPLIATAIGAALTAQGAPAPSGEIAQEAAAALLQSGFAAGTTPSPAMFAAWTAAIAAVSTKTANVSGAFPSLGSAAVEAG